MTHRRQEWRLPARDQHTDTVGQTWHQRLGSSSSAELEIRHAVAAPGCPSVLPATFVAPMLSPMEPVLEQYEVVRLLGSGGMAHVWRVRHRQFGTEHAVKVLKNRSPGLAARLRTEGHLVRSLHHPNV